MEKKSEVSRRSFVRAAAGASALAAGACSTASKVGIAPARVVGASETIVLGAIGTGGRGRTLLKAISNIPDFRVAAVCDLKPDRVDSAAEICQEYKPKVKKYLDFRKMLEREKLDACIVATEEGNHAKCVIPVMEAGLHCFCEKPMDVTVEKIRDVVKTARASKAVYQIGFQRRNADNFQKLVQHIQSSELGKLKYLQGYWQFPYGVGGRYLDLELSGPWFLAQACHHLDVFSWINESKPPLRCVCMGSGVAGKESELIEDMTGVLYEFAGGVNASHNHLMNCCGPFCGERFWVHLEKGGVDINAGMSYPRQGDAKRIAEECRDYYVGTGQQFINFARHIRNNERPYSNETTGAISTLMGLMARDAMYRSKKKKFEPTIIEWPDMGVCDLL